MPLGKKDTFKRIHAIRQSQREALSAQQAVTNTSPSNEVINDLLTRIEQLENANQQHD